MSKLIDNFGRKHDYLRISVTDRCNLRCLYCMPQQGLKWKARTELLTYEEIERLAKLFLSLGITKIRLTGGEPLARRDLETLVEKLGRLGGLSTLAMTTNATLLAPIAGRLRNAGLSALNISLDTFQRAKFEKITRRDCFNQVMDGVQAALAAEFPTLKLNCVVMSGCNDDEILDFVAFAYDNKVNVRFIEFMPFKGTDWCLEKVYTYAEMKALISTHYDLRPLDSEPCAVAKDFALAGGRGSVSFITSISESFCNTCNRLRLTADGSIKSCLFYPAEVNLRDAMRAGASDQQLQNMIYYALAIKPEAHPPAEEIAASQNRAMIEIGG